MNTTVRAFMFTEAMSVLKITKFHNSWGFPKDLGAKTDNWNRGRCA